MQEFQYSLDILKEFFILAVINQMHKKAPLWAQMKKTSKGVFGRRIVIPVQMSFTEAVGARTADDYDLPAAGRNLYDRAYIEIKRNYGRAAVDGLLIAASKGAGGFIDAFSGETKGLASAEGIDLDRQSFGDGAGILGISNSIPTGQVISVISPGGIVADVTYPTKYFRAGMRVDVWTSAWAVRYAGLTIDSVQPAASTITFDADDTITAIVATDIIVREKTYSTAGGWGEMMGLNGIVSDADPLPETTLGFEAIKRADFPICQAYVETTTAVIDEMIMTEDLDEIAMNTDGENPTLCLTTHVLRRKLISDAKDAYQTQNLELKAGWKGIRFVGGEVELPIMVHKFTPTGYMYYVSIPHIKFYALKKLVWDTSGGGTIKPVADKDAYEAWFKMYGNIGTDCSNAHGLRTALTIV